MDMIGETGTLKSIIPKNKKDIANRNKMHLLCSGHHSDMIANAAIENVMIGNLLDGGVLLEGILESVDDRQETTQKIIIYLLNEKDIALGTLDSIHCLLHPTFQLAVRDDINHKNQSDGVKREIAKKTGKNREIKDARTIDQQRNRQRILRTSLRRS